MTQQTWQIKIKQPIQQFAAAKLVLSLTKQDIEAILHKFSPDFIEKGMTYIDHAVNKIYVLKFEIEKMTGKGRKT